MPKGEKILSDETRAFYLRTLAILNGAGVPYLLGGAYSLAHFAGIERHTKDLDIFVRPSDRDRTLDVLKRAGYRTEVPFPHWLGKAHQPGDGEDFIDVIYRSGNGVAEVDDDWFKHAVEGTALGVPARLCPAEEIIWSKACRDGSRERFDAPDIAHLLLGGGAASSTGDRLAPPVRCGLPRACRAHLTLFGFAFPRERDAIPAWVMKELAGRLVEEADATAPDDLASPSGSPPLAVAVPRSISTRGYQDASRRSPRGPDDGSKTSRSGRPGSSRDGSR